MALMNDEFTDYLGKMVQITFGDEKGKVLVGTVKSAEEDHVVILDATDQPHFVSYTISLNFVKPGIIPSTSGGDFG